MKKKKERFKDIHGKTRIGKWLAEKSPDLIDTVGDLLPDNGAFGVIKNLIVKDTDISPIDKAEALNLIQEDLKAFELEAADRDSARRREVELAKVGGTDWMMYLTGIIGLISFVVCVYAVIWIPDVRDNKLFVHLMGMIEGVVITSLFSYYFGGTVQK